VAPNLGFFDVGSVYMIEVVFGNIHPQAYFGVHVIVELLL